MPARVPGNAELDLSRAGVLPEDLFRGANILTVRNLEDQAWWYQTDFELTEAESSQDLTVTFHGVDCWAVYYLNGHLIGESCNMLVEHTFDIRPYVQAGLNHLTVHIRPTRRWAWGQEYHPFWSRGETLQEEGLWVRKAPHVFGWDIMPRAVSAGIWRSVELRSHDPLEIEALYIATVFVSEGEAILGVHYRLRGELAATDICEIRIFGECGSSHWTVVDKVAFRAGALRIRIPNPKLWWPNGYGEPSLYDVTVTLSLNGQPVSHHHQRIGVRSVSLRRQDGDGHNPGQFCFVVNGVSIFCRGTNWVPLDAFHSRDLDVVESRVTLAKETNCNLIRCWGGNVYESDAFFDECDTSGIMVWQDFAMACTLYPQSLEFQAMIEAEARKVVQRLRNHPSLVLWAGDNEVDQIAAARRLDPNLNIITRQVLPNVLRDMDPYRPYLPSSPYISSDVWASGDLSRMPEDHLWGPRDYFKSRFYTRSTAPMISEIGFLGLPAVESLSRMFTESALWPPDDLEWLVHATDPTVNSKSHYWARAAKVFDRIKDYFGILPDDLHDVVTASQIVQAEGFKFAIEWARQHKWARTGILWWNLVDGWPQISEALVDYYLVKKLAFLYVRRSQLPMVLVIGEPEGGRYPIWACNDTRDSVSGTYSVRDIVGGGEIKRGNYQAPANLTVEVGDVQFPPSPGLLLVEWTRDGANRVYKNHYVVGQPPFSYEWYKSHLKLILGDTHDGQDTMRHHNFGSLGGSR